MVLEHGSTMKDVEGITLSLVTDPFTINIHKVKLFTDCIWELSSYAGVFELL